MDQQQPQSTHDQALQAFDQAMQATEANEAAPVAEFAAETSPVEVKPTPEPVVDKQREQLVSQLFANNAKLEREIRELRQKAKQEAPQIDPEIKQLIELKKKAKANPMAWVEAAGLSYDELTEYQLNGGRPQVPEEVLTLREEMANLKKKQEEDEKRRQDEMSQKDREVKLARIKSEVLKDPVRFELTAFNDENINLVQEVIDEAAQEGRNLSVAEAADLVENHILGMAKQFANLSKLRKIFGGVENKPETHDNGGVRQSSHVNTQSSSHAANTNTLTNSLNQLAGTESGKELTDEERRAKAASLLNWD